LGREGDGIEKDGQILHKTGKRRFFRGKEAGRGVLEGGEEEKKKTRLAHIDWERGFLGTKKANGETEKGSPA